MLNRLLGGGRGGMLSGLEIAEAVERQREYLDLLASATSDDDRGAADDRLSWPKRLRLWWLSRQPRIWIDDFDDRPSDRGGQLNPNSYNLRLHPEMLVYRLLNGIDMPLMRDGRGDRVRLDMKKDNPTDKLVIPESGLVLHPGVLYIGRTVEHTEAHNCVPALNGRSSIGRLGIYTHATAGFGDVGFCGTWTLEIAVVHPILVYPNVPICQIAYDSISLRHRPYQSKKYTGQRDATASRFWMECNPQHSKR